MSIGSSPTIPARADPTPPALSPSLTRGQEGKHVVEQLLNRKTLSGRTYYLVRWQGHSSADDSWEPVEHLAHCPERVAEYEAAAPRRPKALQTLPKAAGSSSAGAALPAAAPPPPVAPPHPPAVAPPPFPPPGWTVAMAAGSLALGAAIL